MTDNVLKTPNVFRTNEWKTIPFVSLVLYILLIYDTILLIDKNLFKIIILPQLLGFILLTFIPGFIILRVLRVHKLDNVVSIVLVVGLSMSFNTFLGFLITWVGSIFIPNPISFTPLFISYNIIIPTLLIIDSFINNGLDVKPKELEISFPKISLLILIISLGIIGSLVMNYFNINSITILFIIIISLMPFLNRFRKSYNFIIWGTSISILLNRHLISNHLTGWDVHFQYYISSLIKESGNWIMDINSSSNTLLAVVLLAPIYSIMLDMDLVLVYNIIYPFFFSFVPLTIYYIAKEQFNDDTLGFFASLIYMFFMSFFKTPVDKDAIAQLFLMLVIITTYHKHTKINKWFPVPFFIMIFLSHYGVTYIFLGSLFFMIVISYLFKFEILPSSLRIMLFFVLSSLWYILTSRGIVFNIVIQSGKNALINLGRIFETQHRTGMQYLYYPKYSAIWNILKFINIAMLFFISFGVLKIFISIIKRKNICKDGAIGLIAIAFYIFITIGLFSRAGLGFDRCLYVTLTLLSPYCFIGFKFIIDLINRPFFNMKPVKFYSKLFSLFLCVFYLFNSGLVHELSNDPLSYAVALNKNPEWNVYDLDEVEGIKWLKNYEMEKESASKTVCYVLNNRDWILAIGIYGKENLIKTWYGKTNLPNSYIFLGKIELEKLNIGYEDGGMKDSPFYSHILANSILIYKSSNAAVYLYDN